MSDHPVTLREVAQGIVSYDESFSCRIRPKLMQIEVRCSSWPDETTVLLSPYYQNKLREGTFCENDMDGVLAEIDRIKRFGI